MPPEALSGPRSRVLAGGGNKCGPAPVRPPGGILAALRFGWNVLAPIQLPRATTQQAQPEQQLPEQR